VNEKLRELSEYLCGNVNVDYQNSVEDLHRRSLNYETVIRLPIVFAYPTPTEKRFQPYPHSQIFDDPEKMLYNQLIEVYGTSIVHSVEVGDDLCFTARADFGCGVIASIFGAEIEVKDDNPPWVKHPQSGQSDLKRLLDVDNTDFSQGWCPRVIDTYNSYDQILSEYPELKKAISLVLPDMQGPFDTLCMLRGNDIFVDLYDDPEMLKKVLAVIAAAQVGFAKHIDNHIDDGPEGFSHQHGVMIKGNVLVRNDSSTLISPEIYKNCIFDADAFVLKALNGGGIHACGVVDSHFDGFVNVEGLKCFDFGQPELNNVKQIYTVAKEKKVPLVRVNADVDEICSGAIMKHYPTGVSLFQKVDSFEEAKRIMAEYRSATEG